MWKWKLPPYEFALVALPFSLVSPGKKVAVEEDGL
jgi:hypothetical protein